MQTSIESIRDNEGYVVNPYDWNRELAREMATEEGLELTQDYWPILDFMREYWLENRVAPDVRHVLSHMVSDMGYDKRAAKQRLFELFPYGYVKQACKIAGMQRPRAWSTG